MQASDIRQRGSFAQMKPCGVCLVQTEVAAEEEEGGDHGHDRRLFEVITPLPHPEGFCQQSQAKAWSRCLTSIVGQHEVGLYQHIGA